MAKQNFSNYIPRDKPPKRRGRHSKSPNKCKFRSIKKYNRQGR